MKRVLGRRGVAAAVVVVVAIAVGGIAYASIPDANGVIHGCYRPTTGQLIVATSGKGCEEGWKPLDWSQSGPAASVTIVQAAMDPIAPVTKTLQDVNCATGEVAIAWGYDLSDVDVLAVQPIPSDGTPLDQDLSGKAPKGWHFTLLNSSDFPRNVGTLWVTCAPGS